MKRSLRARWQLTTATRAAVLAAMTSLCVAREASAFCRTTTCDPAAGDDCAKNDNGCVRNGAPLRWETFPISYRFSATGTEKLDTSQARAAIRRAFDAWANVECDEGRTTLRFKEGSDIEEDKPLDAKEGIEKFGIYFRDEEWPHDNEDESLALTNQIYGKVTGKIDYADIEINTAATNFRLSDDEDGIDLQAVVTHEVGHYIGLAHSNDPESIMVARYCDGTDRCEGGTDRARALSPDDIQAVCVAYPPSEKSSSVPSTPEGGCTQAPGVHVERALLTAAFVFLGSSIVRRRRRARVR